MSEYNNGIAIICRTGENTQFGYPNEIVAKGIISEYNFDVISQKIIFC